MNKPSEDIIQEFNEAYTYSSEDCLFVKRLKAAGLSTVQIAIVLNNLRAICFQCFDSDKNCKCWDED